MDPSSFDRLTRLVVSTSTRRTSVASLAAALVRILTQDTAAAQPRATCRRPGQVCEPGRGLHCCGDNPCDPSHCQEVLCSHGHCRCPRGQRPCGERCIRQRQCCGTRCPGELVCHKGRCQCPAEQKRCGSQCIPGSGCCRDSECGQGQRCRQHRCRPARPSCVPEPPATACAGRCGTFRNNCGEPVVCNPCPAGLTCLINGSCARSCSGQETCGDRSECVCSFPTTEGGQHCASIPAGPCPNPCSSTADCPLGWHCQEVRGCAPGGGADNRCTQLCST